MKINKYLILSVLAISFLTSCSSDDTPSGDDSLTYDKGLLIVNEGNYGSGNSSVTYSTADFSTQIANLFSTANDAALLGDTAQSLAFHDDEAFIIVNVSNKIEIVNKETFKSIATISDGLTNPRYIAFSGDYAYVTCWGDGLSATDDYVAVIDLNTNTIIKNISTKEGPEQIIEENGKLYVADKGGYNYGNTIEVIDAATNEISKVITVGDVPNSLIEVDNKLYVLNGGKPSYADVETAGSLSVINLNTDEVTETTEFAAGLHPSNLSEANNALYYTLNNGLYTTAFDEINTTSNAIFTFDDVAALYGFAIHDNEVYVGDAVDYSSEGNVYVYTLDGTSVTNFKSGGVSPNGFYFNE
ncbi:DUF5074 domain-containing protein [Zhouia sp. PK063]|uniref:DUF5074 domain-containing protein n=1 Tax=Zhouia sp. PK063 TaxID=3373602 RepID=UPI003796D6CB